MPEYESVKDFFWGFFFPHSYIDWFLHSFLATATFFGIAIAIIKWSAFKRKFWLISVRWSCIQVILFLLLLRIVPWSQRFDSGKVGVVIAQSTGAELQQFVGSEGIEERLKQELQIEVRQLGLEKLAEVKRIRWKIESNDEAIQFLNNYNASAVIWGNMVQMQHNTSFLSHTTLRPFEIRTVMYYKDSTHEEFVLIDMSREGPFELKFQDSGFSLVEIKRKIFLDILPFVLEFISVSNPELTFELIDRFPNSDPLAPFHLVSAAMALEGSGRIKESIKYYEMAFNYSCNFLQFPPEGIVNKSTYSHWLHKAAGSAKFQQGLLFAQLFDTTNAISCLLVASVLDSSLEVSAINKAKLLAINNSLNVKINLPACFTRRKSNYFKLQ